MLRHAAREPSSLMPLSRRAAASGGARDGGGCCGSVLRRLRQRGALARFFVAFVVVAVATRVVVLPHAVQSERWTRYGRDNEIFAERGDPTKSHENPIECPRWTGESGEIREPLGPWAVGPPDASGETRVFLFAVVASTAEAATMARHFLDFYVRRGGVPPGRAHCTIQSAAPDNPHTATLEALMVEFGVHYDVWLGTFTSTTKAWHRDALVAAHLAPDDWLVVADVDELHQFPGLPSHAGEAAAATPAGGASPIAAYLARAEAAGANYVLAAWEDRVAEGGALSHVEPLDGGDAGTALERQFPLRCRMAEWTTPDSGAAAWLPKAEATKVVANKAYLTVHRSAHKVAWRSYADAVLRAVGLGRRGGPRRGAGWPAAYAGEAHLAGGAAAPPGGAALVSQHYKWIAGLAPYLDRRVRVYEKCGMLWSYESAAVVSHLDAHRGRVCVSCGELACAHADPAPRRRVAIVTSVWDEHVDGVSLTMNRIARFLDGRKEEDVLVLTPHDPNVPAPVVGGLEGIPKLGSSSVPVFALVGRSDYVMGAPLGEAERSALRAYDPDIYHLVSPDVLGFSAQAFAKAEGVCAVCTYHTQLDRYIRFYATKHGLLDKLKPRLAVQRLFGAFYGGCDLVAVPNDAIGDKLVAKMGIPRSSLCSFPRGVNATEYHPGRRSSAFRASHLGARDGDVVVLWAARLVKEKGSDVFADAIAHLLNNATLRERHGAALAKLRFVVVGSGPERDAMERALPSGRTTFPGHLSGDELRATYASSDVYFFPSHTEAFPNTLLEAQASGLAVLAPAYSVNRALVPEGSGLLVDEHADAAAFADGLFRLLVDATYRRSIADRAVAVARNRTWAKAFGGLLDCYDRCDGKKGGKA